MTLSCQSEVNAWWIEETHDSQIRILGIADVCSAFKNFSEPDC